MNYSKQFNETKTEVQITLFGQQNFHFPEGNHFVTTSARTFKVLTKTSLYKKILKKKPIDLSDSYIEGFSYKELVALLKGRIAPPVIFLKSAKAAFIENVSFSGAKFGDGRIDFSYAYFGEGNVDFREASFGKGYVSFSKADFGEGKVDFSDADFGEGNVDFSHTTFNDGDVSFAYSCFHQGHVMFMHSKFGEGFIDFSRVQFLRGDVVFISSEFHAGSLIFTDAYFRKGQVLFTDTNFGECYVHFAGAEFREGNVRFDKTKLREGGRVNFRGAKFGGGNIDFSMAEFCDDVDFRKVKFGKGDLSFKKARLGRYHVDFTQAQFDGGRVDFSDAHFECLAVDFSCTEIQSNFTFANNAIDVLDFSGAMISGVISFLGEENVFKEINFGQTQIVGRLYLSSIDLKLTKDLSNRESVINCQDGTDHEQKAYQWRILKENFRNIGQYGDEDMAYVQFRRNELLHEKQAIEDGWENTSRLLKNKSTNQFVANVVGWKRYWQYLAFYLKKFVVQDIGHFGTSPAQTTKFMLFSIFFFAIVYYSMILMGFPAIIGEGGLIVNRANGFPYSFCFSVATFFTLSFNLFQPGNSFVMFLAGLEGSIGLFLMSYFIVTFARKVLR